MIQLTLKFNLIIALGVIVPFLSGLQKPITHSNRINSVIEIPPTLLDFEPISNTHLIPVTSPVSLTYDQFIKSTTVNSQTFVVHAQQTGRFLQGYSINGEVVKLAPTQPFKAGEWVEVSATTGLLNQDLVGADTPFVWRFRTATTPTNGLFTNTDQNFEPYTTYSLALGDLNQDGHLDIFWANFGRPNLVWFNDGTGHFIDSGQSLGLFDSTDVTLGDLDGDGDLDAVVSNWKQATQIYLNNGKGIFQISSQSIGNSFSTALGDLDGDGDLDLFNGYTVWWNNGQGKFSYSEQTIVWAGIQAGATALGDFDSDGDLDLVVSDENSHSRVWLNNGRGYFKDTKQLLGNLFSVNIVVGDIDGDYDLDILQTSSDNQPAELWLNDGSGMFTQHSPAFNNATSPAISLDDIDGDGDLDVLLGQTSFSGNGGVAIWLNDGQGSFTIGPQHLDGATTLALTVGDMDTDGDLDIYVADSSQDHDVWLNNETASLALQQTTSNTLTEPGNQAVYTITVINNGPVPFVNLVLSNTLPLYSQFTTATPSATTQNNIVTWPSINLPAHSQQDFQVVVTLDNPIPSDVTAITSTVYATGWDYHEQSHSASHQQSLRIQHLNKPFLDLKMNGTDLAPLASEATFIFTVTHHPYATNTNPLGNITINHTLGQTPLTQPVSGDKNRNGVLNYGEQWVFKDTYPVTIDNYNKVITTEATATGIDTRTLDDLHPIPHASHTVDIDYQPQMSLTTVQSPDTNPARVGQTVDYELYIRHTTTSDQSPLELTKITNNLTGYTDCDGTILSTTDSTVVCHLEYAVEATQRPPIILTSTVTGLDLDQDILMISNTHIITYIEYEPVLNVSVTAPTQATIGEVVPYTVTIKHDTTSDKSVISDIQLNLTIPMTLTYLSGDNGNALLEPQETWVYTGAHLLKFIDEPPTHLKNIVIVTGQDINGDLLSDEGDHNLKVNKVMIPPEIVIIRGSGSGSVNVTYPFTAQISPLSATLPITFHWQATEQTPVRNSVSSLKNAVQFAWPTIGEKAITVTIENRGGVITANSTLVITQATTPPIVQQVYISPTLPLAEVDLTLSYDYFDADGHADESIIEWQMDEELQLGLSGRLTIPGELTTIGQQWCAIITPVDSSGTEGETVQSNCVTIQAESLCEVTNLKLSPPGILNLAEPLVFDYDLNCRTRQMTPETIIRWYRDGVYQPGLKNKTVISGDITLAKEAWQATLTICVDGECDESLSSNIVYIIDEPDILPQATVKLTPTTPLASDEIQLSYILHDVASDNTRIAKNATTDLQIRWYRNGILQPAFTNQTMLPALETFEGETWCGTILPYKENIYGIESEPFCVTVGSTTNHPPQVITGTLGHSVYTTGLSLAITYHYIDYDNDLESTEKRIIRWYRNGTMQPAFNNMMALPADVTLAGDRWYATIRPHDGQNYGLLFRTGSVDIVNDTNNTAPILDTVRINRSHGDTVTYLGLSYSYVDVDGHQEDDTQIYWYNNPYSRTTKFDGLTKIPVQPHEIWHARVIPHDGVVYGNMIAAHSVRTTRTTDENLIRVRNVVFNPKSPTAGEGFETLFVCLNLNSGDDSCDPLFEWRLFGQVQTSLDGKSAVAEGLTEVNDEWCVTITPVDNQGIVGIPNTDCVTVIDVGNKPDNTPPFIEGNPILYAELPQRSGVAKDDDNLQVNYAYRDADSDKEGETKINWFKYAVGAEGVTPQSKYQDRTYVPAEDTTPGERWYATVQVHDGFDYSEEIKKTNVITINRPPQITDVRVLPVEAYENLALKISYDYQDLDGHPKSKSEVYWLLNGELKDKYNHQEELDATITQQNQQLTVTLRAYDGTEYSNRITTGVTIGPPKIYPPVYLPLIAKNYPVPPAPTPTPTITPTPTPLPCSPERSYEPNNVYQEACPINLNERLTQTYPNDEDDIFYFVLEETSSVIVQVNDYQADKGYFIIYDDRDHNNALKFSTYLKEKGESDTITLQNLPPGKYYIRVHVDINKGGKYNFEDPYQLQVRVIEK